MNLFGFLRRKAQPIDVSRQALDHAITGRMAYEAADDAFRRGLVCTPHLDKIVQREWGISERLAAISEVYENAQATKGTEG